MLLNSRLFWTQLLLLVLVAAVDVNADIHSWYWTYRGLDTPVHFFAGMWVALAITWLSYVFKRPLRTILPTLALVLLVGIGWEVYEYVFGISYGPYYVFDTSKDILMDVLGGLAGFIWAQRIAPRQTIKNHE